MSRRKSTSMIYLLVISLITAGCASQRAWTYRAASYVKAEPLMNKRVAVLPLVDKR